MGGLPPESMWIPRAIIDRKMRRLIGVTLYNPDKYINEYFVHVACFIKCENLRMSEISRENQRL
jgi:hypothetical protein